VAAAIYVMGHKNPDTDAICSAVGYAALLQVQGHPDAVATRQGPVRRETAYILDRFHLPVPLLVTDVRPRVRDIMTAPPITVHRDTPLYEAGQILQQHGMGSVPVVDDEGRLCGVTSVEDFARAFIQDLDLNELDRVSLHLDNVLRTLGGRALVRARQRELVNRVMVGAMEVASMLRRIEPGILLVIGDRTDAQLAAIRLGVGALVVTGDIPVAEEVVELARARDVTLIAVPHHTYTTVRLIHLSTPVHHVMHGDVPTCYPDDPVDVARDFLRGSVAGRSVVVVDKDGRVAGIVRRTDLLKPVHRQLMLVDHNERGQAVDGIEEAEVLGVVDHHRVADFQTSTPPFMRLEPLGSTSTIVAKLFHEAGVAVPPPIAGALLGGILADTLLFRGPTTTPDDRRVAGMLAEAARVDIDAYGGEILELASDISDRTAEQLLSADLKDFSAENCLFGIGMIETTNSAAVLSRRDELLVAMANLRAHDYTSVLFGIVDIMRRRTTILIEGHAQDVAATFDIALVDGNTVELPGILSRKKNIVPLLGVLARRITAS